MPNDVQSPLLLCADLEAGSEGLIEYAATRARRCRQAVRVLYVAPPVLDGTARATAAERLHALVDAVLAGVEIAGVDVIAGVPEDVIIQQAARWHADPIVLGRRRRSTVERIYVGSTTSAVIALARRPVLVVPVGAASEVGG